MLHLQGRFWGTELCEKFLKVKREERLLSLALLFFSVPTQKKRTQTTAPVRNYFLEDSFPDTLLRVGTKIMVLSKSHYKKEAVNRNFIIPVLETCRDPHSKVSRGSSSSSNSKNSSNSRIALLILEMNKVSLEANSSCSLNSSSSSKIALLLLETKKDHCKAKLLSNPQFSARYDFY
jgi:hypothetical protein